jgi:hypothetical protein
MPSQFLSAQGRQDAVPPRDGEGGHLSALLV